MSRASFAINNGKPSSSHSPHSESGIYTSSIEEPQTPEWWPAYREHDVFLQYSKESIPLTAKREMLDNWKRMQVQSEELLSQGCDYEASTMLEAFSLNYDCERIKEFAACANARYSGSQSPPYTPQSSYDYESDLVYMEAQFGSAPDPAAISTTSYQLFESLEPFLRKLSALRFDTTGFRERADSFESYAKRRRELGRNKKEIIVTSNFLTASEGDNPAALHGIAAISSPSCQLNLYDCISCTAPDSPSSGSSESPRYNHQRPCQILHCPKCPGTPQYMPRSDDVWPYVYCSLHPQTKLARCQNGAKCPMDHVQYYPSSQVDAPYAHRTEALRPWETNRKRKLAAADAGW